MKKEVADKLVIKAGQVAQDFSRPERAFNTNQETFKVKDITPLSESTAAVVFEKQPTGKKALAFFYWRNGGAGADWHYFFPTDSHVLGMSKIEHYLAEVEAFNFGRN